MGRKIAVGVDLGGTNVRVALGDEEGRILARFSERTEKTKGPEGVSEQIIRIIHSLKRDIGIKEIAGLGIGSTGPLDLKKGGLMKPTNIPYDFIPLVKPLKDEFHVPVYLLNDCSAAVVGERFFGAGREHENIAYITLSTGIGGGVYVDDHLLIGKDGNATEIGHFTIDYEGKLLCSCGKRGHWEAYCSGNGIPNYVRLLLSNKSKEKVESSLLMKVAEGDPDRVTSKILYDCAKAGDPLALEIVENIGCLNAVGFACVVDAYDPSLITVGGSIAIKNLNLVIEPIRRYIGDYARNRVPEIKITPLGDDVVLYGALAMVFHPVKY
ncbi:ROK family protein [Candidatus Bathyarchaeota archaeon]|nr:MAG: ROK family protein [Candidatus Bathyarchaeota archaeon]